MEPLVPGNVLLVCPSSTNVSASHFRITVNKFVERMFSKKVQTVAYVPGLSEFPAKEVQSL